jgi:geranylgeranyl pyrophosphate synthase
MMSGGDRFNREVLAASIERGLNPLPRDTDVAEDDRLAPDAAVLVLDTMVAQYAWLSEWADRAQEAATAEVAVELARTNNAPQYVRIALTQTADEARMKLHSSNVPNGVNARQVLESFAKIQRVAARKPDGYGN